MPQVDRVYHPDVDGKQSTEYDSIIFFEKRHDPVERYGDFAQALELFARGTVTACAISMVARPYHGSHATLTNEKTATIGLGRNPLCVALGWKMKEDIEQTSCAVEFENTQWRNVIEMRSLL